MSTAVELLGLACVVAAAYLVDPRLALAVGGLVLVLVGYVLGPWEQKWRAARARRALEQARRE